QRLHAEQLARQPFSDQALGSLHRLTSVAPGVELFESVLLVQNYPVEQPAVDGLSIVDLEVEEATNYPLTLVVVPDKRIGVVMSFRPERIGSQAVDRLIEQLSRALQGMADAPGRQVQSLSLSSADERRRILGDWSATGEMAVEPLLFSRQFEAQAGRTPT